MTELVQEALGAHNMLVTLFLGLMVLYWLLVMVGALDFELDLFDFGDASPEVPDMADSSTGPLSHAGGAWLTAGRFLGFSQVPIVVWGSFLVLFMWGISLVLNYRFNGVPGDRSVGTSLLLLLPNFVLSAVLTKIVTLPVGKLFAAMADADTEEETVLGRVGSVVSMEADETYGQLQINISGAPLLINVRTQPGVIAIKKGESAKVISAGPDHQFYFIETAQPNALP